MLGRLLTPGPDIKLRLMDGFLSRDRQKPKMEVVMHKSPEFDDAVAQESAAGKHASQCSEESPRCVAPGVGISYKLHVKCCALDGW